MTQTTSEISQITKGLDEELEQRLRTIAYEDLKGKIIHSDLRVEELSAWRRFWKRVLVQSNRAELMEVARRLQRLSNREGLSTEERKLVEAAKERVRGLASQWTTRQDLQQTVFAQFDGSKEVERLELKDWTHAQGLITSPSGAAINQVPNNPPHHPNAGLDMDHGRLAYYDTGGAALVLTEGAREGGEGNVYCAQEVSESILRHLGAIVTANDFDEDAIRKILQDASDEIHDGYKGERMERDGEDICMGKTGLLAVKTFPSEYPNRVEVKCMAIGYLALFYRHHGTGQVFPLTRFEKGDEDAPEDALYHDSTTRFFNPQEEVNSYWDWVHFNDALVPVDGDFIALSSRALDNVADLQALETIVLCPVFDNAIPGPTPWPSLPTARQLQRYNDANGQGMDHANEITPEEAVIRLQNYSLLMSRNNLSMNEEIYEMVESRKALHGKWKQMVEDGKISHSQLHELTLGDTVITTDGQHIHGKEMELIELEVDKLLEDLEAIPGRAGDFLTMVLPVYQANTDTKATGWMQTVWTFFGAQ